MKTYKPGDIATALGVSISSIRNWTAQPEYQEFLSDIAKRTGTYENAKQREYTQQDLYVLNTISKQKNRFNDWEDVAKYLQEGNLDTDLPASSALVTPMTAAEGFADAIMLRQQIDTLAKSLTDAEEEVEHLRERVDEVRQEERDRATTREDKLHQAIVDLNRQIARLELRVEIMKEGQDKKD
jgi:DNA-binding transcriptional MerR regulator